MTGADARRYRATIAYDGTHYHGFQRQVASQPTIQGELERTLSNLASRPVAVSGAGRTDSGVHARGQVVAFELPWRHETAALQRALNANLPEAIVVRQLQEAGPTFHPRYDARRRAYEYYLYNAPVRSPLQRLYSWHVRQTLAVDRMNDAAQHLVGVHDFATFGRPPQGENSVREIYEAVWRKEGEMLVFFIEGNAFLYRMVRSIVGTLKAVGVGEWTVDTFVAALQECDRSRAAATAPPHGLLLASVTYDN